MSGLTDDEKLQLARMIEAHTKCIMESQDFIGRLATIIGKMQDEASKTNAVLAGLVREVEKLRGELIRTAYPQGR